MHCWVPRASEETRVSPAWFCYLHIKWSSLYFQTGRTPKHPIYCSNQCSERGSTAASCTSAEEASNLLFAFITNSVFSAANVTRQRRPGTSKRFCQSDMFANEVHSTASLFICRQLTRHNRGSLYPPNRRHSPSDWHRCRILGWHFGHAHVYSLAHFDILDRCAPLPCTVGSDHFRKFLQVCIHLAKEKIQFISIYIAYYIFIIYQIFSLIHRPCIMTTKMHLQ